MKGQRELLNHGRIGRKRNLLQSSKCQAVGGKKYSNIRFLREENILECWSEREEMRRNNSD